MARGKAVVLLSGGLDSATCLAVAVADGFEPHPLTFLYGQRHAIEAERARALCAHYGIPGERHRVVDLGRVFAGSALLGEGEIPSRAGTAPVPENIPPTYVPARNIVFLALAAAYAEPVGATRIYLGVNAVDYSGYPDCRPEFLSAFQEALNLGTRTGVEGRPLQIVAPLVRLSKAQIVQLGHALGVPFHLTHSCYRGQAPACGTCDACLLRLKGFREAGLRDPLPYAAAVAEGG